MDKRFILAGIFAVGCLLLGLASFEEASASLVFDQIVYRTCFQRHGLNFITRWNCRSSLYGIGPVALAFRCSSKNGNIDYCEIADKVVAENKKQQAEAR
jgi:hypothetical protein